MKQYLAFDLGASSGRAMLGTIDGGRVTLEEMHRFENGSVAIHGGLYWNFLGLFQELKTGLRKALESGAKLSSIAVDTWGVDYLFLDEKGGLAGIPHCYRDPRVDDVLDWTYSRISKESIYKLTGIQFMNLNTIFQLAASVRDDDPVLRIADKMLFIPNALTYLFCGDVSAEYSIATTSQLFNPSTGDWAWEIIDALGLKRDLFPKIKPSCSVVGVLSAQLQEELKCGPIPVVLVGSHDTASAVAAVPATDSGPWAYLSSGTWSLLGIELPKPLITEAALAANYTNEGGVGGTIRFLKNIMGLWLIQECRTEWKRQGKKYTFDELDAFADEAEPFRSFINPNDNVFTPPGDMPGRISEYCRRTGQPVLETPGQILRTALESLAMRYRQTLEEIESLTGEKISKLHLVGGGCKNIVLNQFTANAIGRPVQTGPIEATALGNVIGQALALGDIGSLQEGRELIKNSTESEMYLPSDEAAWDAAYKTFLAVQ